MPMSADSLAKQMETPEDREQRRRIADAWDKLAAEVDTTASPLTPIGVVIWLFCACPGEALPAPEI